MRLGTIANVLGAGFVSLVLVSTPALAETMSGASCSVTDGASASAVATMATTVEQATDASHGGGGFWHDAWSFTKGAAVGAATGLAITAGMAAVVATAPVWVSALATATVVGAGAFGAYRVYRNWGRMSTDGRLFVAGNIAGSLAAGGMSGIVSRGVSGWIVGDPASTTAATSAATTTATAPAPVSVPPSVDGLSTTDAAALARQYGYTVTHIESGATAAEVAGATDQGLPVVVKIVVDGNGNPTVAGSANASGVENVIVENMTEDGEVFARRPGRSDTIVWSIPAFDASMRSAGGDIVILHGARNTP